MNEKYKNIPISTPIEPEIELDGGYPYCQRCYTELNCYQSPWYQMPGNESSSEPPPGSMSTVAFYSSKSQ